MVDLVVSPVSFSPNKVGYRKYLKAGGALSFCAFKVFERRTELEVLIERADKMYDSMNYHYDMFFIYNKSGDEKSALMHWESMEIRSKQHGELMSSISKFDVVNEIRKNAFS